MAERDSTTRLSAASAPVRPWGGWVLLASLAALTLMVALSRDDRRLDSRESAAALAACSLLADGDLEMTDGDRARLAELGNAARPALAGEAAAPRLLASPLHALWLAPFATVHPRLGVVVGQWLLLVIAAGALAVGLGGRLGSTAPWWAAAAVWGSAAFTGALRIGDDALVLALLCCGLALACGARAPRASELASDLYQPTEAAGPGLARILVAAALLGLATALRPWLLGAVLALPALLAGRGVGRGARLAAGALAIAIAAAGTLLAGDAPSLSAGAGVEPTVLLRNLVTMLGGPRFGLLLVALPTIALWLGLGRRGAGRGLLHLATPLAMLWLAATAPFSWSAAPATLAGPLALAAAPTWWTVGRGLGRRSALLVLAIGQLLVAPNWSPRLAEGRAELLARAPRLALWETTQPAMPGEAETLAGLLLVRAVGPSLAPTASGALAATGGWSLLLIGSPAPLERVSLRMSAAAPSELALRGGEVAETMFRADGGVDLVLDPGAPIASHPDRAGAATHWYALGIDTAEGGYSLEVAE